MEIKLLRLCTGEATILPAHPPHAFSLSHTCISLGLNSSCRLLVGRKSPSGNPYVRSHVCVQWKCVLKVKFTCYQVQERRVGKQEWYRHATRACLIKLIKKCKKKYPTPLSFRKRAAKTGQLKILRIGYASSPRILSRKKYQGSHNTIITRHRLLRPPVKDRLIL